MKSCRYLFAAATGVAATAVLLATLTSPSVPAGAQAPAPLTKAQQQALYGEKCSACHNLPDPVEKAYNRAQWQRTVRLMITKYKATDISPTDATEIVDYLATFAPKEGRGGRKGGGPLDPWATDSDDVWTVAPSATHVFNFEGPNPLAVLSPLSAGTPGPAAAWHTAAATPGDVDGMVVKVAPVKPVPTRFALLMDRQDAPRDLDVKVRFQILGGTTSPAVGIAFGFQNPKTYAVLRYDAARDELALLQINEPTHTALQKTPVVLPAAGAMLAASVPPAKPAPGWHTLRLLVRDGQVRGWFDMNKRISVQDPGYAGGKIGLWTQGDTIAAFDDWMVDVYDGAKPAPANTDQ